MKVHERSDTRHGIAGGGEPRLEPAVVASDERGEQLEQDLLLALEMIVHEAGRQARGLGDVGDGGAVVARLAMTFISARVI